MYCQKYHCFCWTFNFASMISSQQLIGTFAFITAYDLALQLLFINPDKIWIELKVIDISQRKRHGHSTVSKAWYMVFFKLVVFSHTENKLDGEEYIYKVQHHAPCLILDLFIFCILGNVHSSCSWFYTIVTLKIKKFWLSFLISLHFCLLRIQLELFIFGWQLSDTAEQVNKGRVTFEKEGRQRKILKQSIKHRSHRNSKWLNGKYTWLMVMEVLESLAYLGWYLLFRLNMSNESFLPSEFSTNLCKAKYFYVDFKQYFTKMQSDDFLCEMQEEGLSINVTFVMSSWWAMQKVT